MQGKEPGMVPSPSQAQVEGFQSLVSTNASGITDAGGSRGRQCSHDDSDSFYMKLSELLESSGLSLMWVFL